MLQVLDKGSLPLLPAVSLQLGEEGSAQQRGSPDQEAETSKGSGV